MKKFIVQTACAQMPGNCWGQYRRIGVLEVEEGVERVAMISERARGVLQVVRTWEACHVGKTARSAYHRALAEAEELALQLNRG